MATGSAARADFVKRNSRIRWPGSDARDSPVERKFDRRGSIRVEIRSRRPWGQRGSTSGRPECDPRLPVLGSGLAIALSPSSPRARQLLTRFIAFQHSVAPERDGR